jgi:hypothetical protein
MNYKGGGRGWQRDVHCIIIYGWGEGRGVLQERNFEITELGRKRNESEE